MQDECFLIHGKDVTIEIHAYHWDLLCHIGHEIGLNYKLFYVAVS